VKGLHFKKNPGGHYKILFYVGDFFIPVEETLVQELKSHTSRPPEEFLGLIVEKLGHNSYLKSAIQEVLSQANDPSDLAKTLLREFQSLDNKAP